MTNKTIYINVTIFLPVTIYSNELKRNLPESELSFHAAQKRAGPAPIRQVLSGLMTIDAVRERPPPKGGAFAPACAVLELVGGHQPH